MSLILRQITRRAGGGEIVRNRDLPEGAIRIGRGADCEIRIPDLAVSLHHATLVVSGANRLRVEATGDQPFGCNGGFTRSAEIAAGDGAVLTFGDHSLTAGTEKGQVVLTLTQTVEAPSLADADHAEATGFAPRRRFLSKRTMAWTGLTAILIACLVVPILAFNGLLGGLGRRIDVDAQWSSGPLSGSHAFLENDCQACHQQAFVAVRDETCMSCHSGAQDPAVMQRIDAEVRASGSTEAPLRIADHAPPRRLMWAPPPPRDLGERAIDLARKAFNRPEQRCATCHLEHVGDPLIDKVRAKPTLQETGTCVGCHGDLDTRLKDTELRNAPDWARHPELRPRLADWSGPRPRLRRVSMAAKPDEPNGLTFPHDLHLAPGGGAARMALSLAGRGYGAPLDCASCHVADGFGFKPIQMETACSACHSLGFASASGIQRIPHGDVRAAAAFLSGAFQGGPATGARSTTPRRRPGDAAGAPSRTPSGLSAAQRLRGVFAPGGACYDCHTVTGGDGDYAVASVRLTDTYLPSGAFDHRIREHRQNASGQPNCGECHGARTSNRSADLLLPRISVCADCHGKAPAPAVVSAPANCSTCHSYHAPSRPSPHPPGRREPAIMDGPARRPAPRGRSSRTPVR